MGFIGFRAARPTPIFPLFYASRPPDGFARPRPVERRAWPRLPASPRGRFPALELWGRLQARFAYLLTENEFIPDPQARALSNLIRLPGSLNSRATKPVLYTVSHGGDGKPIMYTMNELAREMRLPAIATATAPTVSRGHVTAYSPSAQSSPRTGVKVPKRRAGRDALIALRERRFWLVVGMRGGIIRDGNRGAFAFCYNGILYGDHDREEKVLEFCKETCRPALTDDRIVSLLKGADKLKGRPYILTDNRGADGKPGIWERLGLGDGGGPVNTYSPTPVRLLKPGEKLDSLSPIEATRHAERTRLEIDRLRNPLTPRPNKGQALTRLRRRNEIVRAALAAYLTNGNKPAPAGSIVASIRRVFPNYSRRTLLRNVTDMRQSGCLTL